MVLEPPKRVQIFSVHLQGAPAAFRASLVGSIREVGTGGMGSKCQGCLAGGGCLYFPAGLGGTRHGEPGKAWGKLSFAPSLAPASSFLPGHSSQTHGTAHPSILLLLLLQPHEPRWFPPFLLTGTLGCPQALPGPEEQPVALATWHMTSRAAGTCRGRRCQVLGQGPKAAWDSRAQWGPLERCQQPRGDGGRM